MNTQSWYNLLYELVHIKVGIFSLLNWKTEVCKLDIRRHMLAAPSFAKLHPRDGRCDKLLMVACSCWYNAIDLVEEIVATTQSCKRWN